ncbi:MAG TPA: tetratricopeptide repeat protein [Terriglobales bacterium]|jgi:tetratricopeptide (TPR) repeat protein|nr:tetratricopeptide repeat protein [Terriglobales bacterium]
MNRSGWVAVLFVALSLPLAAQTQKLVIPAGTPEDQALQAIGAEPDQQKKLAMYTDFVQKFAANPIAVVYGNWQLAQAYQQAGDNQKALEYGDKAIAAAPQNLDILVTQTTIAQGLKDDAKVFDYSVRGGDAYNAIAKQPKPADVSDEDFAKRVAEDKEAAENSRQFLEVAAFNVIAAASDPKTRMSEIEKFTPAFPNSRFEPQTVSYAMMSLSQLNDMPRLIAFGEKTLVTSPENLPALLLLANAYSDDPKPGSLAKSVTYGQKAIAVAKADAPDADASHKASAGAAHSTIGYVYMKQDKTPAAITELKSATTLLKGADEQSYAVALYRLGFAYAKLNRVDDARTTLTDAVKISGPVQKPAQELLAKVNQARAKGK